MVTYLPYKVVVPPPKKYVFPKTQPAAFFQGRAGHARLSLPKSPVPAANAAISHGCRCVLLPLAPGLAKRMECAELAPAFPRARQPSPRPPNPIPGAPVCNRLSPASNPSCDSTSTPNHHHRRLIYFSHWTSSCHLVSGLAKRMECAELAPAFPRSRQPSPRPPNPIPGAPVCNRLSPASDPSCD